MGGAPQLRPRSVAMPFALQGAVGAWLLADAFSLGRQDGMRVLLVVVTTITSLLLGIVMTRALRSRSLPMLFLGIPIAGGFNGAVLGVALGLSKGDLAVVMVGALFGVLCAIPFIPGMSLVLIGARGEVHSRSGTIVSASDRRRTLTAAAMTIAVATLAVAPFLRDQAMAWSSFNMGLVVCATAGILACAVTDVLGMRKLAAVKASVNQAMLREPKSPARDDLPLVDFGIGGEEREECAAATDAYRDLDRPLRIVRGDYERAQRGLRNNVALAAAELCALGLLGLLVMRGRSEERVVTDAEEVDTTAPTPSIVPLPSNILGVHQLQWAGDAELLGVDARSHRAYVSLLSSEGATRSIETIDYEAGARIDEWTPPSPPSGPGVDLIRLGGMAHATEPWASRTSAFDRALSVSADGSSTVYPIKNALFAVDARGDRVAAVAPGFASSEAPVFAPHGSGLFFRGCEKQPCAAPGLYYATAPGANPVRLGVTEPGDAMWGEGEDYVVALGKSSHGRTCVERISLAAPAAPLHAYCMHFLRDMKMIASGDGYRVVVYGRTDAAPTPTYEYALVDLRSNTLLGTATVEAAAGASALSDDGLLVIPRDGLLGTSVVDLITGKRKDLDPAEGTLTGGARSQWVGGRILMLRRYYGHRINGFELVQVLPRALLDEDQTAP